MKFITYRCQWCEQEDKNEQTLTKHVRDIHKEDVVAIFDTYETIVLG